MNIVAAIFLFLLSFLIFWGALAIGGDVIKSDTVLLDKIVGFGIAVVVFAGAGWVAAGAITMITNPKAFESTSTVTITIPQDGCQK